MVDATAIDRVQIETYAAAIDVCDRVAPQSIYEAKFSLQHCVAAALSRDVDFAAFEADERQRLSTLASRVTLTGSDPFDRAYPRAWGSAVSVTLRDGRTMRCERTHAKGDPEAPLSKDEMIAKARRLLAHGDVRGPDDLIASVLALAADAPLPRLALTD
jgi:2-methylcitrate dehydratase PrpD